MEKQELSFELAALPTHETSGAHGQVASQSVTLIGRGAAGSDSFVLNGVVVEALARPQNDEDVQPRLRLTAAQVYSWATVGWRCEISSDLQTLNEGLWFAHEQPDSVLGNFSGVRQPTDSVRGGTTVEQQQRKSIEISAAARRAQAMADAARMTEQVR